MALNDESKLLSLRILQNFVREKKGKWNQDDWKKLMQRVRKAGFGKVDEGRIGKLLEDNRERWLSGDNSVGPPPPGSKTRVILGDSPQSLLRSGRHLISARCLSATSGSTRACVAPGPAAPIAFV
jgi:hypothetical protein